MVWNTMNPLKKQDNNHNSSYTSSSLQSSSSILQYQHRKEHVEVYQQKFRKFAKQLHELVQVLGKLETARHAYDTIQGKAASTILEVIKEGNLPLAGEETELRNLMNMMQSNNNINNHINNNNGILSYDTNKLRQLEKNARFRLNGICQRTKAAWATVEQYDKTLETLQAQQTRMELSSPMMNHGGTTSSRNSDSFMESLHEKIQDTIGSLSMALQYAAECDQDLQQWGLCVDAAGSIDILRWYKTSLQNDIQYTTQQLQAKALVVFQLEEHLLLQQQQQQQIVCRQQGEDELSNTKSVMTILQDDEEDASTISSKDHIYESFFTTPLFKIQEQEPSLDDTAEESSSSSSSSDRHHNIGHTTVVTIGTSSTTGPGPVDDTTIDCDEFLVDTTTNSDAVGYVFEV